jgi:hypothetical protein
MVKVVGRRWVRGIVWPSWELWSGVVCLSHLICVGLLILGHGSGIVIGTGKDTEFGVVFEMMQDVSLYHASEQVDADVAGGRAANTPSIGNGRSSQTFIIILIWCDRCNLPHWCITTPRMARDVYHRRCVPLATSGFSADG